MTNKDVLRMSILKYFCTIKFRMHYQEPRLLIFKNFACLKNDQAIILIIDFYLQILCSLDKTHKLNRNDTYKKKEKKAVKLL